MRLRIAMPAFIRKANRTRSIVAFFESSLLMREESRVSFLQGTFDSVTAQDSVTRLPVPFVRLRMSQVSVRRPSKLTQREGEPSQDQQQTCPRFDCESPGVAALLPCRSWHD